MAGPLAKNIADEYDIDAENQLDIRYILICGKELFLMEHSY